jgi:hypothetical protein
MKGKVWEKTSSTSAGKDQNEGRKGESPLPKTKKYSLVQLCQSLLLPKTLYQLRKVLERAPFKEEQKAN